MGVLAVVTGFFGVVVLAFVTVPQVARSWKKGTAGLSYAGSMTATVVDASWLSWGIFNAVWATVVADSIGTALGVTVLTLIVRDRDLRIWPTVLFVSTLTALVLGLGLAHPILPGIGAIALAMIYRTFNYAAILRSASIYGVSITTWVLSTMALAIWAVHGYAIGNSFLLWGSAVSSFYSAVIAVTAYFKRKIETKRHVAVGLSTVVQTLPTR